MKTIGIFTSSQGHESIANAIAEKIKRDAGDKYKVKIIFQEQILGVFYNQIYKFAPKTLGGPFKWSVKIVENIEELDEGFRKYIKIKNKKTVANSIKKNKIDLAVNTYFTFSPALSDYQERFGTPFLNIVPDPRTPHPISLAKKAKNNFAFNKKIQGFDPKKYPIIESGWFVQKRYEENFDKQSLKKKLKADDSLNILIVSGSEGSNTVLKILPTLINCPKKTNFFVACGRNDSLYKNVEGIKKSIETLSDSKANIIPIGFTKNLHQYMQISDLVIGKAGPNTLFESVATETPFFAITHIHGQEDGNLDVIKEYNLGIVEERSKEANTKLMEIIKNPDIIKSFSKDIKKMKEYNKNSINVLLEEIDKELQK